MKYIFVIISAISILVNTAHAEWPKWEDTKIYFGVEIGKSKSKMESGGFNTAGMHENTNSDSDIGGLLSIKVGAELVDRLRVDLGYRQYENQNYITDSYEPPTPTYFYSSKIESKAVMATAYYDLYKHKKLAFYGGVGLGVSRSKVSTSDTVVGGSGSETNFSWQVEMGADYLITDSLTLNAGLRYFDFGKTEIDLQHRAGDAAGNFTADLSSREAFLGLRYTF